MTFDCGSTSRRMVANASTAELSGQEEWRATTTVKSFQQIISLQFFDIIIIVSPSHDDMDCENKFHLMSFMRLQVKYVWISRQSLSLKSYLTERWLFDVYGSNLSLHSGPDRRLYPLMTVKIDKKGRHGDIGASILISNSPPFFSYSYFMKEN